MSDDPLENFDDLLDPECRNNFIEVMKGWCFGEGYAQNSTRADLVERYISKPAWAWINERTTEKKAGASLGIEQVWNLALKADDIVYILRYKTRPLYPEHVSILDKAWSWLQLSDLDAAVDEESRRRIDEEKQRKEE